MDWHFVPVSPSWSDAFSKMPHTGVDKLGQVISKHVGLVCEDPIEIQPILAANE